MNNIKGRIEAVNQKEKGYGLKIQDRWYNAFEQTDLQKDDYVSIDYEDKRQFHNIKKIEKIDTQESAGVSSLGSPASPKDYRTDDIHLQVCLKIASEQIAAKGGTENMGFIADLAKKLMIEVWG